MSGAIANPLMQENVWLHQQQFEEAEAHYYKVLAGTAASTPPVPPTPQAVQGGGSSLKNEIAQTRQQIQNALSRPAKSCQSSASTSNPQVQRRLDDLEKENKDLKQTTAELRALVQKLESRVCALEKTGGGDGAGASSVAAEKKADVKKDEKEEDEDDDVDLFGDDDDDEEVEALRKKRLEEYAEKKAKKPAVIAKSSVILDVKPWDDETSMQEMERLVRTIEKDGLVWGASKLVDLAYGIKKLQIMCVVEDEKVSVEDLREDIEKFEDLVQSVDIAAFNKI